MFDRTNIARRAVLKGLTAIVPAGLVGRSHAGRASTSIMEEDMNTAIHSDYFGNIEELSSVQAMAEYWYLLDKKCDDLVANAQALCEHPERPEVGKLCLSELVPFSLEYHHIYHCTWHSTEALDYELRRMIAERRQLATNARNEPERNPDDCGFLDFWSELQLRSAERLEKVQSVAVPEMRRRCEPRVSWDELNEVRASWDAVEDCHDEMFALEERLMQAPCKTLNDVIAKAGVLRNMLDNDRECEYYALEIVKSVEVAE
ncbi:MAG: hypothetical protein AAF724_10350 [Pseudomonadota bacterium]